jgi:hypothetical protein
MYLELTTPIWMVEQMINEEFAKQINFAIKKTKDRVAENLRSKIKEWVRSQPEMQSLLAGGIGSLSAMFGLKQDEAYEAVNDISESVANSMLVEIKDFDKKLNGSVSFYAQEITLDNITSLASVSRITDKDTELKWLNWLLFQGDTVIILGYKYTPSVNGRSGGGTMKSGGIFRIPPQFSGVASNNFITRAFKDREQEVVNIIRGLFQ